MENSGKQINLVHVFFAFLRVGLLGYGGGPSSIPLVYKEVVDGHQWLEADEFGDVLAIGNTLPGPIATKMAGYIGYRLAGVRGMLCALLATILPSIILMIVLLQYLTIFQDQPWVQGMTRAIAPVVGAMLAVLTWQFFRAAQKGLGWPASIFLLAASVLLMEFIGLHPGLIIAVLLAASFLIPIRVPGGRGDRNGTGR